MTIIRLQSAVDHVLTIGSCILTLGVGFLRKFSSYFSMLRAITLKGIKRLARSHDGERSIRFGADFNFRIYY